MRAPTVLLVKDNRNDVILIERAFEKSRIVNPSHVVGDGEEAMDYPGGFGKYTGRAADPLPTLVQLDLKLPRRSDVDVLTWLRAELCIRRFPVAGLTC